MDFTKIDPSLFLEDNEIHEELPEIDNTAKAQTGAKLNNLIQAGGLDEVLKIMKKIAQGYWNDVRTKQVNDPKELLYLAERARLSSEIIKGFIHEVDKATEAAKAMADKAKQPTS